MPAGEVMSCGQTTRRGHKLNSSFPLEPPLLLKVLQSRTYLCLIHPSLCHPCHRHQLLPRSANSSHFSSTPDAAYHPPMSTARYFSCCFCCPSLCRSLSSVYRCAPLSPRDVAATPLPYFCRSLVSKPRSLHLFPRHAPLSSPGRPLSSLALLLLLGFLPLAPFKLPGAQPSLSELCKGRRDLFRQSWWSFACV